jgi:hypothetical protein
MKNAINALLAAQKALTIFDTECAEENEYPLHANDSRSRLLFADGGNGLHVQYDGEIWDEPFLITLKAIADASPHIISLRFCGPDEGANGLRTHDFSHLLERDVRFPKLLELYIRPTDVTNHNYVEIEDTQIAPLLARCPNIERLTLPNAPTADFFKLPLTKLRYLRIGMTCQTHQFIRNMAASSNMPALRVFDFTDSLSVFQNPLNQNIAAPAPQLADAGDFLKTLGYDETTLADAQAAIDQAYSEAQAETKYDDSITPFEDYSALIKSPAIATNMLVHLRNAYLTQAQFEQLDGLKGLQLSASIEAPHVYVSHWQGKFATPFQHLIIPR